MGDDMEQRSTYSSDVDPMTNRRRRSINLNNVQWWALWIIAVGGAATLFFGIANSAIGYMHNEAQDNFRTRLEESLTPPNGIVYKVIDAMITRHETHAQQQLDERLHRFQRQQDRNTWILEELYKMAKGTPPPALLPEPGDNK